MNGSVYSQPILVTSCIIIFNRERKEKEEAEEKRRLGIEVAEESEEEELVGDPFKRLDVNTLTKKVCYFIPYISLTFFYVYTLY